MGRLNTDSRVQVQRAHMHEHSPPYIEPQPHYSEQDRQSKSNSRCKQTWAFELQNFRASTMANAAFPGLVQQLRDQAASNHLKVLPTQVVSAELPASRRISQMTYYLYHRLFVMTCILLRLQNLGDQACSNGAPTLAQSKPEAGMQR